MQKAILHIIIFSLLGISLFAQETKTGFGKNRIQYKQLEWQFFSTENYDIYFYGVQKNMAKTTGIFLEDQFEDITSLLGYMPYSKTKIFIYASAQDLLQSNVGIGKEVQQDGGITDFVRLQVEVAFPGTINEFKDELLRKISQVYMEDMLFGGSLFSMVQNAYLMSFPDWYIDGAARYIAKTWDEDMDNYMREVLHQDNFLKLNKTQGETAALLGQSLWNYIVETYGQGAMSNILNLSRIVRNERICFENTLGMPYRKLLRDWEDYYRKINQSVLSHDYPDINESTINLGRKECLLNNVTFSPNGRYLSYSKNLNGKYHVILKELSTDKEKVIYTGGYKLINQVPDLFTPVLTWKNDSSLAIINYKSGRCHVWLYDLKKKDLWKKDIGKFDQIIDASFDASGKLMVMSAVMNGRNDIYIVSLARNGIKRITNDVFDDRSPRFVPGTTAIVFSSNRNTDSLNLKRKKPKLSIANKSFDLYAYDLDTTRSLLLRMTETSDDETKPYPIDTYELYFLNNHYGTNMIYHLDRRTNISKPITALPQNIIDYDIDVDGQQVVYISQGISGGEIHHIKDLDFEKDVLLPETYRKSVERIKQIKKSPKPKEHRKNIASIEKLLDEKRLILTDTVVVDETGLIDINNLNFKGETPKPSVHRPTSYLQKYKLMKRENLLRGPLTYETRFTADNSITSWLINPLMGLGFDLGIEMNDMLEDHKFYGGAVVYSDFKSGDVFAEYQYLKTRLDYHIRYDRRSWEISAPLQDNVVHKYIMNRAELGVSYPFSTRSKLIISPFFTNTNTLDYNYSIVFSGQAGLDQLNTYGGIKATYVFDNTISRDQYQQEGLQAKFDYEHYQGLNDEQLSFSNLNVEVRNYKRIHKELMLATRFLYGSYWGNNPKSYLVGGVDNWLLSSREYIGEDDPTYFSADVSNPDIMFHQFTTNVRGFNYNTVNGTNVLLLNTELRLPISRYLYTGNISSNFMRNLQLVGFFDIASSWTVKSPFNKENDVNTEHYSQANFEIDVQNYRNPWYYSYGAGVRTIIFGYYLRLDFAWAVDDYKIEPMRMQLSLGFDF